MSRKRSRGSSRVREDRRRAAGPVTAATAEEPEPVPIHNDDSCSACGMGGELICCDTCPAAFHFLCCEKPINPDQLPEQWACNVCQPRDLPFKTMAVPFLQMAQHLLSSHPKCFNIPPDIPNPFDRPRKKRRPSDRPDRLHLCFNCGKTTDATQRVKCISCKCRYHIDCLDPPLTHAMTPWKCPNHPEQHVERPRNRRLSSRFEHESRGFEDVTGFKVAFLEKLRQEQAERQEAEASEASRPVPTTTPEEQSAFVRGLLILQQDYIAEELRHRDMDPVMLEAAFGDDVNDMQPEDLRTSVLVMRKLLLERVEEAITPFEPESPAPALAAEVDYEELPAPEHGDSFGILRCVKTGEIFQLNETSVVGASAAADVNLQKLEPPGNAQAKHASILFDSDNGRFEILNHSESAIYIDGIKCSARDSTATVLHNSSVMEIAGLRFVITSFVKEKSASSNDGSAQEAETDVEMNGAAED